LKVVVPLPLPWGKTWIDEALEVALTLAVIELPLEIVATVVPAGNPLDSNGMPTRKFAVEEMPVTELEPEETVAA